MTDASQIVEEQWGGLVRDSGVVVVGELHGTNELPRLVGDLAEAAAASGPVTVGLELGWNAQDDVERYLGSDGKPEARELLLANPIWKCHDGRSSTAVFALIDRCRRARAEGRAMYVTLLDVRSEDWGAAEGARDPSWRDRCMADRLVEGRSTGPVVALVGNVHARTDSGFPFPMPEGYMPAASIARQSIALVSLLGCYSAGHAFFMTGPGTGGAEHAVTGGDLGPSPFISLAAPPDGYDGTAYVGSVTASPPIVP